MHRFKPDLYRELLILRHVEQTPRLNTRLAAAKLGVSVKMAHQTLKRMVAKGWLHVKKRNARRSGVAEKARLTLEFLEFTMEFYREARQRSAAVCRDLAKRQLQRAALIGATDLTEIVYLGIIESGLDCVGIFAQDSPPNARCVGRPVLPIRFLERYEFDAAILCLYDPAHPLATLESLPVPPAARDRLFRIF